ncbi:MAG: hypothetical protein Q8M08_07485 [Bacteroidales bacterium]|nr:hypothetical protein [Bacteroidales bacterium]
METQKQCNHVPGFPYTRHLIRYLFVFLCLSGTTLNSQPNEAGFNPGDQPNLIPSITGPDTVCIATAGYIYATDPGMSDYTWILSAGGVITSGSGTNSIVVTWTLAGMGSVTVSYTSATTPGTLAVNVLPLMIPSISVSPSGNPVCAGTPVTFTASVTNGGTSPGLQWMVNGVPVGTSSTVFTYIPSDGDMVTCTLNSNGLCTSTTPVISAPVMMIVNPLLQPSVVISVSSNPVCQGTMVTLNAAPQNGGPAPVYQWKVNGINAGSINPIFSYIPANGDVVVCEMTSNALCPAGNPAVSNQIFLTVSPTQLVSVSVTPSANPVCAGSPVTFSASAVNGGLSPQYLWKVNGIQAGSGASSLTYIPVNGDAVTCQLTSNASCAIGNPAVSLPVTMITNQVVPVSVSIQSSSNPVCQGMPVTFTATPVNGGTAPVYQWTLNGFPVGTNSSTYTYIPANGDAVLCKLYSSNPCRSVFPAVSNTVNMSVNANVPVSVSISSSANPVCISSSVTITANPFNGGTSPVFQWKVNGLNAGTNSISYTFVPDHGDQVVCIMTSNAVCAPVGPVSSNTLTMTVSPNLPVSASIVSSATTVCQNVQVTFTATPANGGISPSFQWKVNGNISGSNNPVFTHIPQDGDHISCLVTSSAACVTGNPAISNTISMTVIPSAGVPVGVTVTPSANPSCIAQPVTFTAVAVNGGSAPVYAWTLNGLDVGTNSPVYTYIPSSGDFIRCWVTSDLSCAINNPAGSNEVIMTVNPILPVSVFIVSSGNPSCANANVTFTANAVNPGASPVYQWKVNGVNAGSNQNTFSHVPVNGNVVTCVLTSGLVCASGNPATSNAITMSVLPVIPVEISISTLTNPSCTDVPVTYRAIISNGGTSPVYLWKLNGNNTGSNSATLIINGPATGDVITCRLSSNTLCNTGSKIVTSSPITMVVSSELAPDVSITASSNPFCQGTPVTFTATPTNGGTLPVYQWLVNCQPVGTTNSTYTYTPLDGDYVTCQMTSNLSCAVRNPCKSNGIAMKYNTGTPASVQVSTSANPVCPGASATFTATPVNGGTTPAYQWKVNGINTGTNSPGFTYSPANGDVVTCRLTSNAFCASGNPAISNSLTMAVSPALPASIAISTPTNPFCTGTAVNFSAISTNGGSAPGYTWKINGTPIGTNSTSITTFPVSGDVITCELFSNASCISGPNPVSSNPVTLLGASSIPVSISIGASSNPICAGTPVTFTAAHSGGGNNPVFAWRVNGNPAGVNSPVFTYIPSTGEMVSCTLTSDLACSTTTSVASNNIIMTVNPSLPVSVSITVSINPCCIGTPVTFNATAQNGGPGVVYQWIINCVNVGTNNPEYTYVPVNGDVVVCKVTSNVACATDNPAISNNINMVVLPIQPADVSILADPNPFCIGSPVTFTATPTNGGLDPVYQWQVNHTNVGLNNPVFTHTPADGDSVVCVMTSNAACVSGNPAASLPVRMVGISALLVTDSISVSANPICALNPVTFSVTTTNAGNTPAYQWKVNGITKSSSSAYSYAPVNNDVVTCQVTSSLGCATPNPVVSNPITMTVYPQAPVSVSITASTNPVCEGQPVTFTAVGTNPGSNPTYRWRVNTILITGVNSPIYTYTPTAGDVVYCRLTSTVVCPVGNNANSNQITMIVSPNMPAGVSITPSANPVCAGTPVVFTATPFNGGTAPVYQWKVNGTNAGTNNTVFSYSPVNGDVIRCDMLSNSQCTPLLNASSNTVTMTVSQVQPVSISVFPSVNPVCTNSYVNFTAIPVNGGAAPQYQWKVNGNIVGTNNTGYTFVPVNGDLITCTLISGLSCTTGNPATSTPVVMTVSSTLPVSVSLTASANPSCQGQAVNFTAIPGNGGLLPVYQWMVNGIQVGPNAPAYTYVPAQGDYVKCQLTSDFSCATGNPAVSLPVMIEVNPNLPTAISIMSSANPVCVGTLVHYTASPVNGGSTPMFQWKVNGVNAGNNTPGFDYIPAHGDTVACQMTTSIACPEVNPVWSNMIIMNVVEPSPSAVTVSVSQNPSCQGNQVTLLATPENGGYNPLYQWKVNGLNVGTGQPSYTFTPSNGDMVVCEMTSSSACVSVTTVTSEPVTMTVSNELPVSVIIQASSNPVCVGQTVTYTGTIVNGGNSPSYQWTVNGINVGNNNQVFNFAPSDGDIIACQCTSDLSCATGNPAASDPIVMVVTSGISAGITIVASSNPVCLGNPVTLTASYTNAGPSPVFQWKVNGINAGLNQPAFTYNPVNGDQITCQLTANDPCSSANPVISNQVVLVVSAELPANVTISASANQICTGSSVTMTALSVNGGPAPSYQWKVNGTTVGSNTITYTCFPADGDQIQCVMTSGLSCATGNPATSNLIVMAVYSPETVSVGVSANPPGTICAGNSVELMAIPVNGGSSPSYQWFKNGNPAGGNQPNFNFIPSDGDQVYVVLNSNLPCSNGSPATSPVMTIPVTNPVDASVTATVSQNNVCEGSTVTFSATSVNGGVPTYQWFLNGLSVGANLPTYTCIPSDGDLVYVMMTSSLPCVNTPASISNSISMIVNNLLPVGVTISGDQNPVCLGTQVTFEATPENGGSNPVYQWKVNDLNVGTGLATFIYTPSNGDAVACEMSSSISCVNAPTVQSNPVVMTVSTEFPVSVNILPSLNPVCTGQTVTLNATIVNGGNSPTFQWKVNGVNTGTNNPVFFYTPSDGDIVVCVVTSGFSCATGNPATSNAVSIGVVSPMPAGITIVVAENPVCIGSEVTFTASSANPGVSPVYQWKVNGINAGLNLPAYTYIPVNGDIVTCQLTPDDPCLSAGPVLSNPIVMVVSNDLPANITISASANQICAGTPVTFTALPVNGGSTPLYQWKVNGNNVGTNSPAYSFTPTDGDLVQCILTSALSCATGNPASSNLIVMTVYLPQAVSVTISANPPGDVCAGTIVEMTAMPANGGTAPSFQWYKNSIAVGSNQPSYSFIPANGDLVYVELNSNLPCSVGSPAVSPITTMIVTDPLNVSVSAVVDQNDICEGSPVTFTAIPVNGGVPSYQWFHNGLAVGQNQSTYSCIPVTGDMVYVAITSSLTCVYTPVASSNVISMVVNSLVPVSVTILEDQNDVCHGTMVTVTASAVNGGNPEYQWYLNGTSAGLNQPDFSLVPENGDQVYVEMFSSLDCIINPSATSNMITLQVNMPLSVGVDITVDQNPVCQGNPVTFTASPVNGGMPGYQWYKNDLPAGTGDFQYSFIPSDGDRVYVKMSSSLTCVVDSSAISQAINMAVDIPLVPEVTLVADQSEVCEGSVVTFTALPVNGGIPVIRWFRNDILVGESSLQYSCVPVKGDQVHVEMTSGLLCVNPGSAISNKISPVVISLPGEALSISGPANVCAGSTGVVFSILPVPGAESYTWLLPSGVSVAGGEHDKTISLNFNESSHSGPISVYANNTCGHGNISPTLHVEVLVIPEPPLITNEGNLLISSSVSGNQWYFEGTLIPDSVGRTLSPELPGWYWSMVIENGCSSDTSNHIYYYGKFPGSITGEYGFWVYPIPNDGHFTVAISLPAEDTFDITIFNSLGVKIFEIPAVFVKSKFKRLIDLRPRFPKGLYTVVFKCDDYRVVKKVLINTR